LISEKAWWEEDNCADFSFDCYIIERVLHWLEKEDSDIEKLAGTGLCLAAVTYFFAKMLQALL